MNNKGQSLVLFVLLLPIMVMLLAVIFDMGSLMITKNKYENEIKDTIKYGLKNLNKDDVAQRMETLLSTNVLGKKKVEVNDGVIRISLISEKNSLFLGVFNNKYDIDLTYTGYNDNGKMRITKN